MISALSIAPDVRDALADGAPVVALESTIMTHGMPWPRNYETAETVEAAVRESGATPATIAVIDGKLRIGLDANRLEKLARSQNVMKLSRADMAFALSSGRTGSTTVAATMIAARLAGIGVFATGGIGGVHRGVEGSFDISADLEELARTPVSVVCAGAKALLDLPKTLEYLETKGVPVLTYRSAGFPAFWSRDSGLPAPLSVDTVDAIVEFLRMRDALNLGGGAVIANPVPEADEIPADEIAAHIDSALSAARTRHVTGKDVTPFVLNEIYERTGGRSLETNIALVKNNAELAAEIAVRLAA